jgi:hypothetical protein
MNDSTPEKKRPYTRPEVQSIKLATTEVLTEGCKTITPGTGYNDPGACAPISQCTGDGS